LPTRRNWALTEVDLVSFSLQIARVPRHAPAQRLNLQPGFGRALSVIVVFGW
jgi:hypothetical protein